MFVFAQWIYINISLNIICYNLNDCIKASFIIYKDFFEKEVLILPEILQGRCPCKNIFYSKM